MTTMSTTHRKTDMNNKPVAWAYIKDGDFWDAIHPNEHAQEEGSYTIPLYTHPVKELTDEEIYEIAKECKAPWHSHAIDPMMFARAILRKAQENG